MNQSIFIIRHDFFDNPLAGQQYVQKLVHDNCKSEKLALVYDPIAEDFFTHIAKSNRELLEQTVSQFYSHWEGCNDAMPLKWYQLDELVTFHIAFLSPMLFEIDKRFGSYLIGCIPMLHYEPNMYLYFMMSSYDVEDVFLLIDGKTYMKVLEHYIDKFNDFVREHQKGKKLEALKK